MASLANKDSFLGGEGGVCVSAFLDLPDANTTASHPFVFMFHPSALISQLLISSFYNLNLDNLCFIFWCCQYHPAGVHCMIV